MLPKLHRLTKKKDFETLFSNSETIKNGLLIVRFAKNTLGTTRVGFVVSKKVSNKANVRNTLKRKLRSIVAQLLPTIKNSEDIVIITLPGIQKKDSLELFELIVQSFKKGKLYV